MAGNKYRRIAEAIKKNRSGMMKAIELRTGMPKGAVRGLGKEEQGRVQPDIVIGREALAKKIALETGVSKGAAKAAVDAFTSVLVKESKKTKSVSLGGLGRVSITPYNQHNKAGSLIKLSPSKSLKNYVGTIKEGE